MLLIIKTSVAMKFNGTHLKMLHLAILLLFAKKCNFGGGAGMSKILISHVKK